MNTLAIITVSIAALTSSYIGSRTAGKASFLQQIDKLTEEVNESIESSEIWIEERKKLGLYLPPIVASDIALLKELIDALERINNHQHQYKMALGWAFLFLSSSFILVGFLRESSSIKKVGLFSSFLSSSYLTLSSGLYSSSLYSNPQKDLAKKILKICETLQSEQRQNIRLMQLSHLRERVNEFVPPLSHSVPSTLNEPNKQPKEKIPASYLKQKEKADDVLQYSMLN